MESVAVKLDLNSMGLRKEGMNSLEEFWRDMEPVWCFVGEFHTNLSYQPAGHHLTCLSLVAGHDSDMGSELSDQCMIMAIFHQAPGLTLSRVGSLKKAYFVFGKDPVRSKMVFLKLQIKPKCSNPTDPEWQFTFFSLKINLFWQFPN